MVIREKKVWEACADHKCCFFACKQDLTLKLNWWGCETPQESNFDFSFLFDGVRFKKTFWLQTVFSKVSVKGSLHIYIDCDVFIYLRIYGFWIAGRV